VGRHVEQDAPGDDRVDRLDAELAQPAPADCCTASSPPCSRPFSATWPIASRWVPVCPLRITTSFDAPQPSGRIWSPWRTISEKM
jgi:hypothetical protein